VAWTESHQSLLDHRKTLCFARELGVDQVTAIGHLHIFWWWALDNAPDGNITKIDPDDIAQAARYHANDIGPETSRVNFLSALVAAQFVDKKSHGADRPPTFHIHDWKQYGGRLCAARAAHRDRMRRARAPLEKRTLQKTTGQEIRSEDLSSRCLKDDTKFAAFCTLYENEIGPLTGLIADRLKEFTNDYPLRWFEEAVKIAVANGKRKLAYIEGVLKNYRVEGFRTEEEKEPEYDPNDPPSLMDGLTRRQRDQRERNRQLHNGLSED